MLDKRFYEHREPDPARNTLALLFIGLAMLVIASSAGAIATANELGCPTWLSGAYPMKAPHRTPCFTSPVSGLLWNVQYRWLPSRNVRRNLSRWSPSRRHHFYGALDTSLVAIYYGGGAGVLLVVLLGWRFRQVAKSYRPMHKGTRFWATDEEVFRTGLAVNYQPPLHVRLKKLLSK